jgi:hypothetical protein
LGRSGNIDMVEKCLGRRRYRRSLWILLLKKDTENIDALPFDMDWGVCIARNLCLFERKETPPLKCVI